jgi:hypothetical protein
MKLIELLIKYGWAIIIIVVAITAIYATVLIAQHGEFNTTATARTVINTIILNTT